VAQGWRTDAYRAFIGGSTAQTHILAIDYRGFGFSTGFPTEEGLITDGIAAVNWALKVARVPQDKIAIIGHSLGTAVAAAVAEHFARRDIEFAGVVLYAGFTSLPDLLSDYCLVGWLSPLRSSTRLLKYFTDHLVVDKWPTADRIASFARASKHPKLYIIHSLNDYEIRPHHATNLRFAAIDAVEYGVGASRLSHPSLQSETWLDRNSGASATIYDHENTCTRIMEYIIPYGCKCFVHSICPVSANTPQIIV
jgi:abhydrolase domain-containing protein 12